MIIDYIVLTAIAALGGALLLHLIGWAIYQAIAAAWRWVSSQQGR
jgi:hypothetical protein